MKDAMLRSARDLIKSGLKLVCWQVRWDNQVGLDMNFGRPHLVIREPRRSSSRWPRVRALAARRRAHLHGTHWLQIAPEAWEIVLDDGTRARRGAAARQSDVACARLTGERLVEVRIDVKTGVSEFRFDLGGVIRVRRPRGWGTEPDDQLWTLHGPGHQYVAVFAGGTYSYGSTRRADAVPRPMSTDAGSFLLTITSAPRRSAAGAA